MTCTNCGCKTDWLWGEGWQQTPDRDQVWLVGRDEALCASCYYERLRHQTLRVLIDWARHVNQVTPRVTPIEESRPAARASPPPRRCRSGHV